MRRVILGLVVLVLVGCGGNSLVATPTASGPSALTTLTPAANADPAPINVDTTTGAQWLLLPIATKTAAMQWFIRTYPNLIDPCANPTPAMLMMFLDRYAAMAERSNYSVFELMTLILAENKCLQ